jgi:glycosyltransferase involved in cell wall biosynthesis
MSIGLSFIVGQLGLGGAEQQLFYLLRGLDRSRFRPIVISLGPRPNEYWEQPITQLGIQVHHIPRDSGRLLRVFRIADVLRVSEIQIVHGWVFHSNPYAALAGLIARIPVRLGSMREAYSGLPNGRFLRWIGYRGLDALVTNSTTTAQEIKRLSLLRTPIQIVPNGVAVPEQIDPFERAQLRLKLGFCETEILIGSIGRLDRNKNYFMLLRVFALLAQKWPLLRLVIIGQGPMKAKLTKLSQNLGIISKISLPGSIPFAARYLQAMEICCLTSFTEGMPNIVMEAAAAGLPVVSVNCGDTTKLVDHGISGYLVNPDDDTTMSAHLDKLLTDTKHRLSMGRAAREKMLRDFSLGSMVMRMTHLYEETLAEKVQHELQF